MPEFVLDHGSREASERFKALSEFEQGYVECMFFTETGSADDGELEDAVLSDLSEDAWRAIKEDCAGFLTDDALRLIDQAPRGSISYDESRAGHDFWLTRNRHGAGFWDRGLGRIGEELTDWAHSFGSRYLYKGDDGLIYLG